MRGQCYIIPRYLDEPMRLVLWTWDELLIFAVPTWLFYQLLGQLLIGIIIGIVALLGLKRAKGDRGRAVLQQMAYWYLPEIIPLQGSPPAYIQTYIG